MTMTEQDVEKYEQRYEESYGKRDYTLAWRTHRLSGMVTLACFFSFLCGGAVSAMVYMVAISIMHGVALPTYYFYIDIGVLVVLWIAITTCVMQITSLGGEMLRWKSAAEYWADYWEAQTLKAMKTQPVPVTGADDDESATSLVKRWVDRPVNAEPRVRFVPHCDEYKVGEPCPICGAKEMGSLTATFCKDFACEEEAPHLHGDCQVCKGEFVTCLDVDYSTIEEEP